MRALLRPLARRGAFRPAPLPQGKRRLLLLQLDGLSRARLSRAMTDGLLPRLRSRLEDERLVLSRFRPGIPSSTPAFQAGLFYGRSPSVPGFVWCDRASGREVRMDRPADAAALEARLRADGPGLLRDGSAYFGIFTGEAAMPRFCLSAMAGRQAPAREEPRLGAWDLAASALVHSWTAARGLARAAVEAGRGIVDGARWTAAVGRLQHEPRFLLHRTFVAAVLRELAVQGVLLDVSRGVPIVYVDFLAFDEAAHRRGPDSPGAMGYLEDIDRALGTILSAVEAAPELGYDVHVLSDHGQVATQPFELLAGVPLTEFVARAERGERLRGPLPLRPDRGLARGRTLGGAHAAGVAVAEGGDLAHVYFLEHRTPLSLEAARARHGRVLAALASSPAVGILAARGGRRGLAMVRGTTLDLADARDVERLPYPDPALLAAYLSDLVSLPDSGDLVVLGWRGEGRRTVAYAWEFGSHGGVAPEELECFVAHPPDRSFAFDRVVRPSELHAYYEEAYRTPVARPTRPTARAGAEGARAAAREVRSP